MDEAARIAAAADGDPAAQAWLVERWTPQLYRFARRFLGNEQDARDAAQDTMVKLLRSLDRYDRSRAFSTWAYRIARNTCIDLHRKRSRQAWGEPPEQTDPRPSPLQEASRQQAARRLHEALDALSPLYREVLVMYHFEHLKYREIAETLDIPIGTVMNRIFRARRKLRALYAPHEEAP